MEIILHHYPASPVSEKVRVALGIKKLAWRSVEIPRVPPKPDVLPLTGGYRRTPFMQVGADIYCDSHCILRELQRRHREPDFFPGHSEGVTWALGRWADSAFDAAVRLSLGANIRGSSVGRRFIYVLASIARHRSCGVKLGGTHKGKQE